MSWKRSIGWVVLLVASAWALGGLAASGAAAWAPEQVALGARVFATECARCHGAHGEGAGPDSSYAPQLIGPRALSGFCDAAQLHEFVSQNMPEDHPGTLTDAQYWAVLAWLLSENGLDGPDTPLGPETASAISLSR